MNIPASSFEPEPRIDSALVILDVRQRPAIDVADFDAFFRFVEAVFQFRRKQIGGTVARIAGLNGAEAAERLRGAGIDPSRRPQTLTVTEWQVVYGAFNPEPGR
jgi:16S rRNA (adenine1518-N6/adenine1519-N6)-dimethyltransferase